MDVVCFDIGGTEVKYGLLDKYGKIISKGSFPTIHTSKENFVDSLAQKIKQYESKGKIDGIGISIPGVVEVKTGKTITAGALYHLYGENIKDLLSKYFPYPISVENDANSALMAETLNGAAKGMKEVIMVTIGTGIGGAILSDGKIVYGNEYKAGEFGMMRLDMINQPHVTLHELASTAALIRLYKEEKKLSKHTLVDPREILLEMETDEKVYRIVNQWASYLAAGLFNIIVSFNPQKVIIGGGISANAKLLPLIHFHLSKNQHWQDFEVSIEMAKYRNDAGLIGALASLLNTI